MYRDIDSLSLSCEECKSWRAPTAKALPLVTNPDLGTSDYGVVWDKTVFNLECN